MQCFISVPHLLLDYRPDDLYIIQFGFNDENLLIKNLIKIPQPAINSQYDTG